MIQIDLLKLMRSIPRFLRRHSPIKAFLRLAPASASQCIAFNNHAHAYGLTWVIPKIEPYSSPDHSSRISFHLIFAIADIQIMSALLKCRGRM
jgi:hypothetical protein